MGLSLRTAPPHSASGPSERKFSAELNHVIATWIAEIEPREQRGHQHG